MVSEIVSGVLGNEIGNCLFFVFFITKRDRSNKNIVLIKIIIEVNTKQNCVSRISPGLLKTSSLDYNRSILKSIISLNDSTFFFKVQSFLTCSLIYTHLTLK